MSDLDSVSTQRGRDTVRARHGRQLLRVDGITWTVVELAAELGCTERAIRRVASHLVHRPGPLTMADFR